MSAPPRPIADRPAAGPLSFARLKWISFLHSCIYTGLLVCAFVAGKPEPLTFVLGLTHGLLWILMSIACVTAARLRVVPLRLAADLKPGPLDLKAKISWLECKEQCIPGNQNIEATLNVGNETK